MKERSKHKMSKNNVKQFIILAENELDSSISSINKIEYLKSKLIDIKILYGKSIFKIDCRSEFNVYELIMKVWLSIVNQVHWPSESKKGTIEGLVWKNSAYNFEIKIC
jgi:hypothetical protein